MILGKQQVRVSPWEIFISSLLISLRLWLFPAPSCWVSVLREIQSSWPGIHFSFLWGSWESQWTSQLKNLVAQQYFNTMAMTFTSHNEWFKNKIWAYGIQLWLPRYIYQQPVSITAGNALPVVEAETRGTSLLRAFYCWARSSYILVFNRLIQINITGEFKEVCTFF